MDKGHRLRPGQVRDAITAYLRERRSDASIADIRDAVEKRIGLAVSASSVRSYLNLNTPGLFRRPERGRYRLNEE